MGVIPALVVAGGAIAGGAISASGASSAANAQAQAAEKINQTQSAAAMEIERMRIDAAAKAAEIQAGAQVEAARIGAAAAEKQMRMQLEANERALEMQIASYQRTVDLQMQYLADMQVRIDEAVNAGIIDVNTGFDDAVAMLQPFTGLEEYNAARQLLENPESVFERPGVQFQYDKGVEALQTAFSATSGGGVSGNSLRAATEFGQNYAAAAIDQELARLSPFINMAFQSRGAIGNLETARGTTIANLKLGGATGSNQAIAQMSPGIVQGMQAIGNAQASNAQMAGQLQGQNALTQGQITANQILNVAGIQANSANTQAMAMADRLAAIANANTQYQGSMGQINSNLAATQANIWGNAINQAAGSLAYGYGQGNFNLWGGGGGGNTWGSGSNFFDTNTWGMLG